MKMEEVVYIKSIKDMQYGKFNILIDESARLDPNPKIGRLLPLDYHSRYNNST